MRTYTIPGTYGSSETPCDVICAEVRNGHGATWYCVAGSQNVNLSPEPLTPGVNVEEIQDIDAFTWPGGIDSEEELANAINA